MRRGTLIYLEGIDNSGKSCAQDRLQELFKKKKVPSLFTCEPTQERRAKIDQQMSLAKKDGKKGIDLQKLFIEDRRLHQSERIIPALNAGKIVICDRGMFSTFAYGYKEDHDSLQPLIELHKDLALSCFVIWFRVKPEIALARFNKSVKEPTRWDDLSNLRKLNNAYKVAFRESLRNFPECYLLELNANGSKDEVFNNLLEILKQQGILN